MITIVLCTYNDSLFLRTAIPSCFQQDIDKEVILVDDCSSKPIEPDVMEMVNTRGIKYLRHGQNMGLSASRNTGIAAVDGSVTKPLIVPDWPRGPDSNHNQ